MADKYYQDPLSIADLEDSDSSSVKRKIREFRKSATDPKNLKKTGKSIKTIGKGFVSGATFGVVNPGSKEERESLDYRLGSDLSSAAPYGAALKAAGKLKKGVEYARSLSRLGKTSVASKIDDAKYLREKAAELRRLRQNPGKIKVDMAKIRKNETLAKAKARSTPIRGEKAYGAVQDAIDNVTNKAGLGVGPMARAKLGAAIGVSGDSALRIADKTYKRYKESSPDKSPTRDKKYKAKDKSKSNESYSGLRRGGAVRASRVIAKKKIVR